MCALKLRGSNSPPMPGSFNGSNSIPPFFSFFLIPFFVFSSLFFVVIVFPLVPHRLSKIKSHGKRCAVHNSLRRVPGGRREFLAPPFGSLARQQMHTSFRRVGHWSWLLLPSQVMLPIEKTKIFPTVYVCQKKKYKYSNEYSYP